MEKQFLLRGLKYHVFPGAEPVPLVSLPFYNQMYHFWQGEWMKTLKELDGAERLFSNDFMHAGERTCVTFNNEVIAYFSFNWFDLRQESDFDHNYFKAYPRESLLELQSQGFNKIMSMGWLTVKKDWRKSAIGPHLTEALIFQGYLRFLESDMDTLVAFTRNDRRINDRCYRYGSKCLRSNLREHNVQIDLVYTEKTDVRPPQDELTSELAAHFWTNRIIYMPQINKPTLKVA